MLADASALFLSTQSSSHAMAKVLIYDYSVTSDKGPSEIGTRDTCFDPMLIL